jgi:hypothetical protein
MNELSKSKDESLLSFYEGVRQQVDADVKSCGRYRFMGESVKQYADRLSEEMERRRLQFTPIDWQRWLSLCNKVIGGTMTGDQSRELRIGEPRLLGRLRNATCNVREANNAKVHRQFSWAGAAPSEAL